MSDVKLYKWLLPGKVTPVAGYEWPVRKGLWAPAVKPVLCESGYHASPVDTIVLHLPKTLPSTLWEVEGLGERVEDAGKVAFEQMRLVRKVGKLTKTKARLLAADYAERVLPIFEDRVPGDDRPRKAIEAARAFARGEISVDDLHAAYDAAYAAYNAAYAANAAAAAAYAAASAASAAAYAANAAAAAAYAAAARDAARAWQGQRLLEVLEVK